MRMLYQVPPLYRDKMANLQLLMMTLALGAPILLLLFGNIYTPYDVVFMVVLNIFIPLFIIGYVIIFYYPALLRTYGSQTFYSTDDYLIKEDRLGFIRFKKRWKRADIRSVRKNIEIRERHTKEPQASTIEIATRLLIERNDGTTEVLLKADDQHLNGLLHELKIAGFNTKGLMHQALDKAKELFDRFTAGDFR